MINVIIEKLRSKQVFKLYSYLYNCCEKVCFTTLHNYYLDENIYDELIDEYRERCKSNLTEMKKLYGQDDKLLAKVMKKYKLKSKDDFDDFLRSNYEAEMALNKNMSTICEKLFVDENKRDYSEEFKSLAAYFDNAEVHFFDQLKISIFPLDTVTYLKNDVIEEALLKTKKLTTFSLFDEESKIAYSNPGFIKSEKMFAIIDQFSGLASLDLSEEEYEAFKHLKIKHIKEAYSEDEE